MSIRSIFAILALAASASWAGHAPEDFQSLREKQLAQLQEELSKRMVDMAPLMGRLRELSGAYWEEASSKGFRDRRSALLREIHGCLDDIKRSGVEFDKRRVPDLAAVLGAYNSAVGKKGPKLEDDSGFESARRRQVFSDGLWHYVDEVHEQLALDERAFRAALRDHAARRRMMRLTWLSGAAAALAGILLLGTAAMRFRPRKLSGPLRPSSGTPHGGAPFFPQAGLTEAEDRAPPAAAGEWRIGSESGCDPMGSLYEGAELSSGRKAVIRRLRPEIVRSGQDIDDVLAEARKWQTLKHPHVLELYAVLRDGPEAYLVMEPDRGKSLSDSLGVERRVGLQSAKLMVRQAASALGCAHSRGILHRDIKPSNIWIFPEGPLKIADFGVSHLARLAVAKRARGESWGSDPYMAPECETGHMSCRSDVYALGVILYEILAGQRPFPGPDFTAQKRLMLYPLLSEIVYRVPQTADAVIRRALMFDEERRYASMEEFAADVRLLS